MPIQKMTEVPYPGVVPWLAVRKKINEIIDGQGEPITVDDALSSESENPVQNKVITDALAGKADTGDIPDISGKANMTVSGTQPADAAEGDFWYDSTNDALYQYDGTTWKAVGGNASVEKSVIVAQAGTGDFTYDGTTYSDLLSLVNAIRIDNVIPGIIIVNTTYTTAVFISPFTIPDGTSGGNLAVISITKGGRTNRQASVSYTVVAGELTSYSISYFDNGWMFARIYYGGTAPSGSVNKGDLWYDANNNTLSFYDGTGWKTITAS